MYCHTEEELDDAFARASNEAKASFGDGSMFAEKCARPLVMTCAPFRWCNAADRYDIACMSPSACSLARLWTKHDLTAYRLHCISWTSQGLCHARTGVSAASLC